MQAYGGDRLRIKGEHAILHSPLAKEWVPRTPATLTHAEYPGTTVVWDDEYFEVVSAEALPRGGFRYVLAPWRDDHTIRRLVLYDAATEEARLADEVRAQRQRRNVVGASIASAALGHLPEPVQNRIANDLGVAPSRMTLVSCVPAVVLLGSAVWVHTGATLRLEPSPVPLWVWLFALPYLAESAGRYLVAMSQNRGAGSILGYVGYALFWVVFPGRERLVRPFESERGNRSFMLAPDGEVARRDEVETKGVLLALLPRRDQERLVERTGFDFRRHAEPFAAAVLILSLAGSVSSLIKLLDQPRASLWISLIVATAIAFEQIARLRRLRNGEPAASLLGYLVRPFVRSLLVSR